MSSFSNLEADYYFIYHLIKTQYVQFTIAATLPQLLSKVLLENKKTAPLVTLIIKTLGEQGYDQKLKLGMLMGGALFGLTSCCSSLIGFYAMDRMAGRFKKLLNDTILTPTATAEIVISAKKIEEFSQNVKSPPAIFHLIKRFNSPIAASRRGEDKPLPSVSLELPAPAL